MNNLAQSKFAGKRRPDQNAPGSQPPKLAKADASAGLKLYISIEEKARNADSRRALYDVAANDTKKLIPARQVFAFTGGKKSRLCAMTGITKVDRTAPLAFEMENLVERMRSAGSSREYSVYSIDDFDLPASAALGSYPFRFLLWLPFHSRDNEDCGGMLLVRETPWQKPEIEIGQKLAAIFAYSVASFSRQARVFSLRRLDEFKSRRVIFLLALLFIAALAFPVRMSVVAPLEVVPKDSFLLTAPMDAILEDVLVDPGQSVEIGQPLVAFADTVLRNEVKVAEGAVRVAEARLKKANQVAFDDAQGRQALGLAIADHALERAELEYASEMFERSTLRAEKSGIVLFTDKKSLIGKPVITGELLMQIVDPLQTRIQVDVPSKDSIALTEGARVKLFLDSEPLRSREAVIEYSDYRARLTPAGDLVFRVTATFTENDLAPPRLGVRGTAHVYGEKTWLGFYLFRRPLSALRQWVSL